MNPRAWISLSRAVVLESIRRKDLWVVAILGFVILIGSGALGIFGVEGLDVFIRDLATTVLGLFSTLVAGLVSTRMVPEEIKQRTLYPLLARPISRLDLLIGKLLGAILVSWISFAMLAAMTALALLCFHIPFEPVMAYYVVQKMLGLTLICGVGLAFSLYMSPAAAATMTLIISFGSAMISHAFFMAGSSQPSVVWLYKILNGLIPQVQIFDFGTRATFGLPPPFAWVIPASAVYALVYVAAMVGVAYLKFRKQAL